MINLIKVGGRYNAQIEEYEVDEYSEISQITPAPATGSVARVISTGKTYKLLSSGSWAEFTEFSGGYSLPAVTTDDNGKLLGVQEGSWTKVAAPVELPSVSSDDNGKLLGVSGGVWTKVAAPTDLPAVDTADNGAILGVVSGAWAKYSIVLDVIGTFGSDGNGKTTLTLNKTAAELFSAVSDGMLVRMTSAMGENLSVTSVCAPAAVEANNDGTKTYAFRIITDDGSVFSASSLTGTDAVVLTQE